MATQDLSFASSARPKDWVTKGRAHTFSFKAYSGGAQVVPSSATITIRKPGGGDLTTPVSAATVTIDGSGNMTYALASGNTSELGANYVADVVYVVSTVSYDARVLFDVVRVPLLNVVVQADLAYHHSDLTDYLTSAESNAQVYIKQAYEDVCEWLDGRGNRPYLTLNASALRRAIEHRALSLLFFSKRKSLEDRYATYATDHETAYQAELAALGPKLVYDFDQSGTADGTSVEGKTGEEGSQDTGFRIVF